MKVKDLIQLLDNLTDEQKEYCILLVNNDIDDNVWLDSIEVSNTGDSGYEIGGEIRLIGSI